MSFNIVLVHPEIPQNTGSIGRLAAATDSVLHLVEPLGFELSDRYLKRAGLDYWPEIKLIVHPNWDAFCDNSQAEPTQLWFLSRHAKRSYHAVSYRAGDFLVFGCETKGLPAEFQQRYAERLLRIPMDNPRIRSLNLANAVSIVLYEGRRQVGLL